MGGFTLVGSHYVFENLPNKVKCRCVGYNGMIDEKVEQMLLNKQDKTLQLEDLPDDLLASMEIFHLGDEMRYSVKRRVPTNPSASRVPFGGTSMEHKQGESDKKETPFLIKKAKPWHR